MDGRALGLVVVELFGCGFGVDEPHIAVLFDGGINGCLPCCFSHGEDMRRMLMVALVFACECVGDVVEVDANITRLRMLSHKSSLARSRRSGDYVECGLTFLSWCRFCVFAWGEVGDYLSVAWPLVPVGVPILHLLSAVEGAFFSASLQGDVFAWVDDDYARIVGPVWAQGVRVEVGVDDVHVAAAGGFEGFADASLAGGVADFLFLFVVVVFTGGLSGEGVGEVVAVESDVAGFGYGAHPC